MLDDLAVLELVDIDDGAAERTRLPDEVHAQNDVFAVGECVLLRDP
jgi:hypothetical protein